MNINCSNININPKNNYYHINNVIPFRSKFNIARDILIIKSPQKGLVKHNSFLHPNLKLVTKENGYMGVFASGKIKKNEIVCIFVGDFITGEEVAKLPLEMQCKTLQVSPNIYQLGSKYIDKLNTYDAAEYFNHSCEPNLFLTGNNILVAQRKIKKGEELCYDYAASDSAGNPELLAGWKCRCGSVNCRGGINAEAYKKVIPELAQKHGLKRALNMVSDYIAKLYTSNL